MSIESQWVQELRAQRALLERLLVQQERATAAMEKLAQQFDNVTAGGNSMRVEVMT